jgi:hypothetical protein
MIFFKLYEDYTTTEWEYATPQEKFKYLGIATAGRVGGGEEGSVYQMVDGRTIKIYDTAIFDQQKTLERVLYNLEKAKGKPYKHLMNIHEYIYEPEKYILCVISETLDENPMLEYVRGTEIFVSDFFNYYTNSHSLEKATQDFIKAYTEEMLVDENGDEFGCDELYAFNFNCYTDSVKAEFADYFAQLVECGKELEQEGFDIDSTDENIMYDHKTKTYKVIDYLL